MRQAILVLVLLFSIPMFLNTQTRAAAERGDVTYHFGEDVSPEDEAVIREGIRAAQDFSAQEVGHAVRARIAIHAGSFPDAPWSAFANNRSITIATDHQIWIDSSPFHRLKIVIHEYFHLVQYDLANFELGGPRWLIEGAAEYVAYSAVARLGIVDWNIVLDRWTNSTLYQPALAAVPLHEMENPAPEVACCFYEITPLAVHFLLQAVGFAALRDYYSEPASEESFFNAFGTSMSDFYASFAATRQQLYVAGYDQTMLNYPDVRTPGAADIWGVTMSSPVARGEQALLRAVTFPGIACTLTFTSASGNHLLTQPTHALPDGSVFWLWSVRQKLSEGDARADVTCGTNTISVPVTLI